MFKKLLTLLALGACVVAAQAQGAKWPDKPIHVIVPFAAGGSVDGIARLLGIKMGEDLGQPIIIENRGGAGGLIAFEQVVRAKPDGYTLLLGASGYTTVAAMQKLPYDPVKDITPITMVNYGPLILTVSANVPAANLRQFIELLKSKPGSLNFGTPGIGSGSHLAGVLFQQASGTSMLHVPYQSDGQVLTGLQTGDIQFAMASGPALTPLLKSGKARALATTSDKRWPSMPDVPTVAETIPGFSQIAWHGVWGPANMPPDVVARLNQAFRKALALPEVQQRLLADGRMAAPSTPEEFGRAIVRDIDRWSKAAKAANLSLNN